MNFNALGFFLAYKAAEKLPDNTKTLYGFLGAQIPPEDMRGLLLTVAVAQLDARSHKHEDEIDELQEQVAQLETLDARSQQHEDEIDELQEQVAQLKPVALAVKGQALDTLRRLVSDEFVTSQGGPKWTLKGNMNVEYSNTLAYAVDALSQQISRLDNTVIDQTLLNELNQSVGILDTQILNGGGVDSTVISAINLLDDKWSLIKQAYDDLSQKQNESSAIETLTNQIIDGGDNTVKNAVKTLCYQIFGEYGDSTTKSAVDSLEIYIEQVPEEAEFPTGSAYPEKVKPKLLNCLLQLKGAFGRVEQAVEIFKEQILVGSVRQAVSLLKRWS